MSFISGPESEIITSIHPYQQKIFLKMNCVTGPATVEDKALTSTYLEALSWVIIRQFDCVSCYDNTIISRCHFLKIYTDRVGFSSSYYY